MTAATLRRLIVIGLIALWEVLPRAGLVPELFLPSLSSTLTAGWTEAGEYRNALATTLYEVAISMAFACGGGILLGALVGSLPRPRVLIMPMISSLYAVPLVILYPVFTVWLGIGSESKIAFASIYGFLPTMLATAAGIQTIDPQLLLAARSMGATLAQRLVRVIVPAAIPTVLSGLRVGGALVIVGVVVSEMLISSAGIGYLISRYRMHEMWRLPAEHLEEAQDDATIVAIRDMERAGIDIVTDGEIRRESYSNRFATALDGIDADNPAIIATRGGQQTPVPRVVGKVRRRRPVER